MRQLAIVEELFQDYALVNVKRATACGENCAMCKGGCETTTKTVRAQNLVGAKPGDNVVIEIADSSVLLGALAVYIMPVFLMLAVFLCTQIFLQSELLCLLFGLLALVISLIMLKKVDNFLMKSGKYRIYITKNLNSSMENDKIIK